MKVSIKCHLNSRYPGIVYATVRNVQKNWPYDEDDLLISGTLDYCLSACHDLGHVVENGNDVLYWLHVNVEFKGYSK